MKPVIFIVFGATGDLARRYIFPALAALFEQGAISAQSKIIGVSRRDWNDSQFREHAGSFKKEFAELIVYSKVDIDAGTGYAELDEKVEKLKAKTPDAETLIYLSVGPAHQTAVLNSLFKEKILEKGNDKLLIEKPFGTDEASARALDKLLLSHINEDQIYRIDHYLGKDTVQAIMDLQESTNNFSLMLTHDHVASVRIVLHEKNGIEGRGATYDSVGAFRDVGQNHLLEMLAVIAADPTSSSWQEARTDVLRHLAPPAKTCELSHRGQYEGYTAETGVLPGSETETAFQVITSLSKGKLTGVPLILESGKKMPAREAFVEVLFHDIPDMPKKMKFSIQPQQEIVIEYDKGKIDRFDVPKTDDAYTNVIRAALHGELRSFVGSAEIEALWRYADHIVACWKKIPLQIYGEKKPFLVE